MTADSSQPLHTSTREFSSRLDDLTPMRNFVREMCQSEGVEPLPVRWHFQLELAVNEAASNVMRYGLNGADDQPIEMEADVFDDRIVLRILHRGRAVRPFPTTPPPASTASRAGGFGVYIIQQAVDYVEYRLRFRRTELHPPDEEVRQPGRRRQRRRVTRPDRPPAPLRLGRRAPTPYDLAAGIGSTNVPSGISSPGRTSRRSPAERPLCTSTVAPKSRPTCTIRCTARPGFVDDRHLLAVGPVIEPPPRGIRYDGVSASSEMVACRYIPGSSFSS